MQQKVTWKSAQNRYKSLQELFDCRGGMELSVSGTGGEVGELIELPIAMREAREDMDARKMRIVQRRRR